MMMKALEAGGLEVVRSPEREEWALRFQYGDNYQVNRDGLYEPVVPRPTCPKAFDWPRRFDGKAMKVVAPFQHRLAVHDYRAIFMVRDPQEASDSYNAAFNPWPPMDPGLAQAMSLNALDQLRNRKDVRCIHVFDYNEVLEEGFHVPWPIDLEKANSIIDKERKRFAS